MVDTHALGACAARYGGSSPLSRTICLYLKSSLGSLFFCYHIYINKLTKFQNKEVTFVETQQVKEGVEADLYSFYEDNSKDLAIVRAKADYKTPMQRILKGEKNHRGLFRRRRHVDSYTF